MKNKELTALEALSVIYNLEDLQGGKDEFWKAYRIIENALKDYEMEHTLRIRLENINYELVREKQENEKKLKALEIIKNHKLLNYVLKNPKCASMYHLDKSEIEFLEGVIYEKKN